MSHRRVPVVRGGQGRDVEVSFDGQYTPMQWDHSDLRVKDLDRYRPSEQRERWEAHKDTVCDLVLPPTTTTACATAICPIKAGPWV